MRASSSVILGFFFLVMLAFPVLAQIDLEDEAKKQFASRNYKIALKHYLELIEKNPSSLEFQTRAGQCYLYANLDKKKAVPFLEKANAMDDATSENLYLLAQAYHHALRFGESIATFEKYIEDIGKKNEKEQKLARREIQKVQNAERYVAKPINVTFENVGRRVNSEFADYYPFVSGDGNMIIFTTRRKGNTGGVIDLDGYYTSEIYWSVYKNNIWSKTKNIGVKLNTDYDEEAVGLSADGKKLVVYIDHEDSYGDLYLSKWDKSGFQLAVDLGKNINSNKLETAGFINDDETVLLYSTYRAGGQGSLDIWQAKKLPNGAWGESENLGEAINSPYDEDFPMLTADGKTLYFASNNDKSMGGFDVFKSVYDSASGTWSEPQNLGYPLNDTYDNMVISFLDNGREAFLSSYRDDSFGDLDVYEVTLNDKEANVSVLDLRVIAGDTAKPNVDADIVVSSLPDKVKYGEYKTRRDGKAALVLEAGRYQIDITSEGFKSSSKEVAVDNKKIYTEFIPQVVRLESTQPKEANDGKAKPDPKAKPGDKKKPGSSSPGKKSVTSPKKS